jgi:hypothetical protein
MTRTRLELENDNAYLRTALIATTYALKNLKDNVEAGRFQITVLDDGEPKPGNMDAGGEALKYATECLTNTLYP